MGAEYPHAAEWEVPGAEPDIEEGKSPAPKGAEPYCSTPREAGRPLWGVLSQKERGGEDAGNQSHDRSVPAFSEEVLRLV